MPSRRRWLVFLTALLVAGLLPAWLPVTRFVAAPLVLEPEERPADAILVLGHRLSGGHLSEQGKARLDHALAVARRQGISTFLVSGGGSGAEITEAGAMRRYLIPRLTPPATVLTEAASRSTWENLLFARPVLEAHGLTTVQIVTSPYHTRRVAAVARELGYDFSLSYPADAAVFAPGWRHQAHGLLWTLREYLALALYDLVYLDDSALLLLLLPLVVGVSLVKCYDIVRWRALWAIRHGEAYAASLRSLPALSVEALHYTNRRFRLRDLEWSRRLASLPHPLGPALSWLYRFPVVFVGAALAVPLYAWADEAAWKVGLLTANTLLTCCVQVFTRYATRLSLGQFADLDESLILSSVHSGLDEKLLRSSALRRIVLLFIGDVGILLACFACAYAGVHHVLGELAFAGVERPPGWGQLLDFLYYSIVVFTTTGFGDLVPVHTLARAVTALELLLGFLHVVGLVLVLSLTARSRPFSESGDDAMG